MHLQNGLQGLHEVVKGLPLSESRARFLSASGVLSGRVKAAMASFQRSDGSALATCGAQFVSIAEARDALIAEIKDMCSMPIQHSEPATPAVEVVGAQPSLLAAPCLTGAPDFGKGKKRTKKKFAVRG